MPKRPFDDNKHPRDTGKFSRIQGGKGQGPDEEQPEEGAPGEEQQQPTAQEQGPLPREVAMLRTLGFAAGSGYSSAQAAIAALHTTGDLQAMQHHGQILKNAIKDLKTGGATPEEIQKLRKGLTGLHSAVVRNDKVGAHEALSMIQHGFYHAHASFQNEHGPGGFSPIGAQAGKPGEAPPGGDDAEADGGDEDPKDLELTRAAQKKDEKGGA